MQEFSYTITDPNGIHARPAGLFVKKMQEFKSSISICRAEETVDAKKLLAIMKMRLKCGQTFTVRAEGEDENFAISAAKEFFEENVWKQYNIKPTKYKTSWYIAFCGKSYKIGKTRVRPNSYFSNDRMF